MNQDMIKPVPPRVARMSSERKSLMVQSFESHGRHYSPSGLTANLIANWCLTNKVAFTITYDPDLGFTIIKGIEDGN